MYTPVSVITENSQAKERANEYLSVVVLIYRATYKALRPIYVPQAMFRVAFH
jgi:hypothetical protein